MNTQAGKRMEEEISNIPKFGATASLPNLNGYLDLLGHPEKELKVIHVAGTNGKGSTCAFMESVLRNAGYKTALFTSPHLVSMTERFRINFIPCEESRLTYAWEVVKQLMRDHKETLLPLTYFEILFVMSLIIFKEEKPDYCIMETGLGGRLDATVLTDPIVSIITSISLDHTAILGDTIEEIAGEKAGIIKEGIPVIALDEKNGAYPVIERTAYEKHSKIFRVSSEDITILKKRKNGIDFSFHCSYYNDEWLRVESSADYQALNASLCYVAMRVILPDLDSSIIKKGIEKMRWEGRMEEILPNVFVDGAHNPGAISQITDSFHSDHGDQRWALLFAVCADKDFTSMIRDLATVSWEKIYITRMKGTRGASIHMVKKLFTEHATCPVTDEKTVKEAFCHALSDKEEYDSLLCLGSLYLVGELKEYVKEVLDKEGMTESESEENHD